MNIGTNNGGAADQWKFGSDRWEGMTAAEPERTPWDMDTLE